MATKYVSGTGTNDVSHGSAPGSGAYLTINYALTGSRLAWGDTLIVQTGATMGATNIYVVLGVGDGTDFIIRSEDETVVVDLPTGFNSVYPPASNNTTQYFTWAVNITNTLNVAPYLMQIYTTAVSPVYNIRFGGQSINTNHKPVDINMNATSSAGTVGLITFAGPPTGTPVINIDIYQAKIHGIKLAIFVNSVGAVANPAFVIRSSAIYDYGALYNSATAGAAFNVSLYNVTRYGCWGVNPGGVTGEFNPGISGTLSKLVEYNSMWVKTTRNSGLGFGSFYIMSDTIMTDAITNKATKWFRSNNVAFLGIPLEGQGDFQAFVYAGSTAHYIPFDPTFWFLDPKFIDAANDDFHINPTADSWISGRGNVDQLPPQDIEGYAWTGADIGAYRNPTATKKYASIKKGLKAIGGDSIGLGANNRAAVLYPNESYITTRPAWDLNGNTWASWGGIKIGGYFMILDYLMTSDYAPEYLGLVLGANNGTPALGYSPTNYHSAETSPYTNAARRAATDVSCIFKKYMDWAGKANVYPVWLGMGPIRATDGATTWNYAKQQGWSDNFSELVESFVSGVSSKPYVREMKRLHPTDWYTGDYDTVNGNGTRGPYYNALWIHGAAGDVNSLNVHPHEAGSDLIAGQFKAAIDSTPIKKRTTKSGGFGF